MRLVSRQRWFALLGFGGLVLAASVLQAEPDSQRSEGVYRRDVEEELLATPLERGAPLHETEHERPAKVRREAAAKFLEKAIREEVIVVAGKHGRRIGIDWRKRASNCWPTGRKTRW